MKSRVLQQGIVDGLLWRKLVLGEAQVGLVALVEQRRKVLASRAGDRTAQLVLVEQFVYHPGRLRINGVTCQ